MKKKLKMELSIRTLRNMLYAAWYCGYMTRGITSTHPEAVAERKRLGELLLSL